MLISKIAFFILVKLKELNSSNKRGLTPFFALFFSHATGRLGAVRQIFKDIFP